MIIAEDLRVQRSKRLLSDAMIDLVMRKDYDSITIQEICDQADVGKHTFYRHFKDKRALMHAALDSTYRELARHLAESRDDMRQPIALKAFFEAVGRDPKRYSVLFQGAGRMEFHMQSRQMLAYYMMMQMNRLNPATDAPLNLIIRVASGIILEMAMWWLDEGQPHTPEIMASLTQRLLAEGVAGAFGLTIPAYNPAAS